MTGRHERPKPQRGSQGRRGPSPAPLPKTPVDGVAAWAGRLLRMMETHLEHDPINAGAYMAVLMFEADRTLDRGLMRARANGFSEREMARVFGVSHQAIHKRIVNAAAAAAPPAGVADWRERYEAHLRKADIPAAKPATGLRAVGE